METKEDITKRVLEFHKKDKDKKVLEGKVMVQGKRIETPGHRVSKLKPIYFEPELITYKNCNVGCMQTLLEYLQRYQPINERGLIFFPSARFSLHAGENHLTLYMQAEISWAGGEAIDVFDRVKLDSEEFEEIIRLMQERASHFVLGKLRERKDQGPYTILRRYFSE